jgi:hypothetical protein
MQRISKECSRTIAASIRNAVAGRAHPRENVRRNTGMHTPQSLTERGACWRAQIASGAFRTAWNGQCPGVRHKKAPDQPGLLRLEELAGNQYFATTGPPQLKR